MGKCVDCVRVAENNCPAECVNNSMFERNLKKETGDTVMLSQKIDENRRVEAFVPDGGGIQFAFWNGACKTQIKLSDAAFVAAVELYAKLQKLHNDPAQESGEIGGGSDEAA